MFCLRLTGRQERGDWKKRKGRRKEGREGGGWKKVDFAFDAITVRQSVKALGMKTLKSHRLYVLLFLK